MSVVEVERVVTRADVLTHAADILEEFEWRQGSPGSREEGSMCAIGAINEAGRDLVPFDHFEETSSPVRAAWLIHGKGESCSIVPLAIWNDAPERMKAEVVAELRRFAEVPDA